MIGWYWSTRWILADTDDQWVSSFVGSFFWLCWKKSSDTPMFFRTHQSVLLSLYLYFLAVGKLQVSCGSWAQMLCQPQCSWAILALFYVAHCAWPLFRGKQLLDPTVPACLALRQGSSLGVTLLRPNSQLLYKPCRTALNIHLLLISFFCTVSFARWRYATFPWYSRVLFVQA